MKPTFKDEGKKDLESVVYCRTLPPANGAKVADYRFDA
jgi:hypothetical protein